MGHSASIVLALSFSSPSVCARGIQGQPSAGLSYFYLHSEPLRTHSLQKKNWDAEKVISVITLLTTTTDLESLVNYCVCLCILGGSCEYSLHAANMQTEKLRPTSRFKPRICLLWGKSTNLYKFHPGHGSLRSVERKQLDFFKVREDIRTEEEIKGLKKLKAVQLLFFQAP